MPTLSATYTGAYTARAWRLLQALHAKTRPLLPLLWMLCLPATGAGQESSFSYFGKLSIEGKPADGRYDVRFRLFDQGTNGAPLGASITNLALPVRNGLFTAMLDARTWLFDGSARWMEVAVRTNGAGGDFTVLSPRQPVMPTPQSLFASRAGMAQVAEQLRAGAPVTGDGSGLTNISGLAILPGSIDASRLDPATDAAYRAGTSNRVTVINVKDFGARGDGATDDTIAISNAWSAFIARGGTLYFPQGIYLDSGTHESTAFVPTEPYFRDGRTIMGLGAAVWVYTGSGRLLSFMNSAPNIENLEFRGNPRATNCMYVSTIYGKMRIRNCFFYNWPNTTSGALVIDEADGLALEGATFTFCNIGLGCGYRCSNLMADVLTSGCELAVAIGVPTATYPNIRESQNIELNLMSLYGHSGLAVDAGATALNLRGYFWWCTNAVIIGKIPGISTNFAPNLSMAIEHSYWRGSAGLEPAIQLHAPMVSTLSLSKCRFDSAPGSPPVIKSYSAAADRIDLRWEESLQTGPPAPVFEDSTGVRLAEVSQRQTRLLNRGLGLYNGRQLGGGQAGGSGYLLDVMDASRAGPVARIGVNATTDTAFGQFLGGLVIASPAPSAPPQVTVTNADFVLAPPTGVPAANSPGQPGTIRWDSQYIYLCVGTNQWKRAALGTW